MLCYIHFIFNFYTVKIMASSHALGILKYINIPNFLFVTNNFLNSLIFGRIPTLATTCNIYNQTLLNPVSSGNSVIRNLIDGLNTLLSKAHKFKGKFIPSKWRWYHRHGYWATRKKKLKFDTYRRHRYHEVRGPGPRAPSRWEDQSFYKPLRQSIKFW